jgi:putative ABC transport system ATP-binding protein
MVGIAHRVKHRPTALSVGEQQRVAVARALVNRPQLLLADEPTANIDTHHQQQVIDLLRRSCAREDVALLLVTHAAEVAAEFDDVRLLEQFNHALEPST